MIQFSACLFAVACADIASVITVEAAASGADLVEICLQEEAQSSRTGPALLQVKSDSPKVRSDSHLKADELPLVYTDSDESEEDENDEEDEDTFEEDTEQVEPEIVDPRPIKRWAKKDKATAGKAEVYTGLANQEEQDSESAVENDSTEFAETKSVDTAPVEMESSAEIESSNADSVETESSNFDSAETESSNSDSAETESSNADSAETDNADTDSEYGTSDASESDSTSGRCSQYRCGNIKFFSKNANKTRCFGKEVSDYGGAGSTLVLKEHGSCDCVNFMLPPSGTGPIIDLSTSPPLCVTIANGQYFNGNAVYYKPCRGEYSEDDGTFVASPDQTFIVPSDNYGPIRTSLFSNRCLNIEKGNVGIGHRIQIWRCGDGNGPHEMFTLPEFEPKGSTLS